MAIIGDRVLARWPQEVEWWYPGVICDTADGFYHVQYDDGDRAALDREQVRPLQLTPGTRVYCRWKGGQSYYPGVITSVQGDAIHVDYDDGDKEHTAISMLRMNQADLAG